MADHGYHLDVSAYISTHPSIPVANVIKSAADHLRSTLDLDEPLMVALLQHQILLKEQVKAYRQSRPGWKRMMNCCPS